MMTCDADWNDTASAYDAIVSEAKSLMLAKNHDYGESWREMRLSSITDQILVKIRRIQQLEEFSIRNESSRISEGIDSEYRDILNYSIFALIKLKQSE